MSAFDDEVGNEIPDEEAALDAVLGENPRARELRLMRHALEHRREQMQRAWERATDARERASLNARLDELDAQIAVMRQEEAIATFVESSVRVALHTPAPEEIEE